MMLRTKTVLRSLVVSGSLIMLAACGSDRPIPSSLEEAWDGYNRPEHLLVNYEARFAALPRAGQAQQLPWADTYWPNYKGGIAWQWRVNGRATKPTLDQLRSMTPLQISRLSPAEKYDIYVGNYGYPLTAHEERRTSPNHPSWWGLCHGWAPAAINFPKEPGTVTLRNRDGIAIPFWSSDIKGLLTFAQQYNRPREATNFLGLRCNRDLNEPGAAQTRECKDVNAGSWHIILANKLGVNRELFVADLRRGLEVWNYPIYSYQTEVLSETTNLYATAAPGTVRIVKVRTTLRHAALIEPRPEPLTTSAMATERYTYNLELDRNGRIIGGEWDTFDHPDFLWKQTAPQISGGTGFFSRLGEIYEASLR